VFQAFNLIATLTAEENILLPATAAGVQEDLSDRLTELVSDLGIADCRGRYPDSLSGGQQQRVAIARALLCEPDVLLADEPTGSLDSAAGQQLCRLLRTQHEHHRRTIVVVTHEPAVAAWADKVIVLKDGATLTQFDAADVPDSQALASRYQEAISQG
jgi:putative ABC transport system ATP-binding protein